MNQGIKGIYIHVPFCVSKCNYCSFYSIANPSKVVKSNYTTRLIKEIMNCDQKINDLTSIYFGGGTPSLVDVEALTEIVQALETKFMFDFKTIPETTIEINPGTVDSNYLKTLKELGFNRISLGVQSLNDYTLNAMGRAHNAQDSLNTLENLESLKFNNISVDLMFNYPGQDLFSTEQDILTLLKFNSVKHFSIYSVTVEDNTKLAYQLKKKLLTMNDDRLERYLYYRIRNILKLHGIKQYEISNFAKPGYESKHNTLYWDRLNYLSFGPASSSFIDNQLIDYKPDLRAYLNSDRNPNETIKLSNRELKEDFMIFGLRKTNGIFDSDYNKQFKTSFFREFDKEIDTLVKENLVELIPDGIKLTKLGIDFYDKVAIEFIN